MLEQLYKSLLSALFCAIIGAGYAQVEITGQVVDNQTNEPVIFASVILKDWQSGDVIKGVNTEPDGTFKLQSNKNKFSLEVRMLKYESLFMDSITVEEPTLDVGQLRLKPLLQGLEEVTVRAEKSTTEFRLDKRVFNVGKDISSTGASALEVLNNVPSVTVNIEGMISLRGSSGVQILIDGKPSVMSDDPANALGTITADMIERIEVITNPSAKYQSEGTSGIINIVLRKEEKKGINGSITLNGGWPHNHSLGFSLNARTERFNIFTQIGAGYRSLPRYRESTNRDLKDSVEIASEGVNYRDEQFYNITLGTDYHINKYNTLTLSGNFAYEIEKQPSETEFVETKIGVGEVGRWTRSETTEADNPKYQYDLQYKKEFKDTSEHTLIFSTLGRFFGKTQSSEFTNETTSGSVSYAPQRTQTSFKQADYTFKLDYLQPFNEMWTLEAGAQYVINDVGNDYSVQDEVAGEFVIDSSLTNNFKYLQNVLGVYSTGSFEKNKWGLKLGLRVENTDLRTELVTNGQKDRQLYTNFFPTVHTAYKFSRKISMQLGYSRRIFRPRLWDLNPFFNISNNFNIRRGNPELLPEFTDSYELMSIYVFDKISMNFGIYYRYTTQKVERVSIFENNVNTRMPLNIGTNEVTGVEFNSKITAAKWLTFNTDFNLHYFNRKGEFQGQNFDFSGDKWQAKLLAKIKVAKPVDLELTGNYESDFKTIQGNEQQQMYMNAGLRIKLWKGKGIINVGVRDVFASRIWRTSVDQPDFYLYSQSTRGRFMTLGFSYGFGKGEAMTYSGGRRH